MQYYTSTVNPKEIKELCILQPWKALLAIGFDWGVIAASIAVSEYVGGFWIYLLAILLIAGRMHGLGVMMHDGAHFRIFKNKRLNDWVTDLLVAWPVLSTAQSYRNNHLTHHQHLNTERDPDWITKISDEAFQFPQTVLRLTVRFLGYLVAVNTFRDLKQAFPRLNRNDQSTRTYKALRLGFYVLVIAACTWFGVLWQFFIYWVVPYFTVLFFMFYVRNISEHFGGMNYEEELGSTRTVLPYWWERLFFAPHNVNYHIEHHLYPGVPFYNLPRLHAALMRDETYRSQAHLTRGYSTGLLHECLTAAA